MFKAFRYIAAIFVIILIARAWSFTTVRNKAEAVFLVDNVVASVSLKGDAKTFSEVSDPKGPHTDGDLYAIVYDLNGRCLAHGSMPERVGRVMIDDVDTDGHPYIKERLAFAKVSKSFWQEYKFYNPSTSKIQSKTTYCRVADTNLVCAGVYR